MSLIVIILALIGLGSVVYYGINQLTGVLSGEMPSRAMAAPAQTNDLRAAIEKGNITAIDAAKARGVNLNAPLDAGRGGLTPLMHACCTGRADVVEALIKAGANVNARTSEGRTALMFAAGWGNAATVKALLDAGARENERADDGMTALMFAAARGEMDCLAALRNAGADINARNKWGQNALMAAAVAGDAAKITALLTAGASPNEVDRDGMTALNLAAASDGGADALRALLDAKADANIANGEGLTPLMNAAYKADAEKIDSLVKAGANKTLKDRSGRSAADWAASRDDDQGKAVAELLRN